MAAIIGDRPVQWSKTSEKQTEILSGTDARSKRLGNATQRTVVSHTRQTMYKTIKDFEGCLDVQEPETAYQSNPKPKVSATGQIKLFSKD